MDKMMKENLGYMLTTNLGRALKEKRGERSIREIAEDLDVPHSTLYFIEADGRMPAPDVFVKLLHFLGVVDDKLRKKLSIFADPKKTDTNGNHRRNH